MLLGDAWAEGVVGKVPSNSDSCGQNHLGVLFWQRGAFKLSVIHVACVLGSAWVLVVVLDDWVKELLECRIRVVTGRVHTDSRVNVLGAGENHKLKRLAVHVCFPFVRFINFPGQVLGEQRLSTRGELNKVLDVAGLLQMGTCFGVESLALVGLSLVDVLLSLVLHS